MMTTLPRAKLNMASAAHSGPFASGMQGRTESGTEKSPTPFSKDRSKKLKTNEGHSKLTSLMSSNLQRIITKWATLGDLVVVGSAVRSALLKGSLKTFYIKLIALILVFTSGQHI